MCSFYMKIYLFIYKNYRKYDIKDQYLDMRFRSRCAVDSMLAYCVPTWYTSCMKAEQAAVQHGIRTAEKITTISTSHSQQRSHRIISDSPHPAHHLFQLLHQGKGSDPSEPGLQKQTSQ